MKYLPLVALLLVLIVIFGCAGGGGGGGTATNGTTATTSTGGGTIAIVAESAPGVLVDPTNLQVGDSVTFKLVSLDLIDGTYSSVSNSGFSTTDTKGQAGTLNSATGAYTATHSSNGTQYKISTSSSGVAYSAPYQVNPVQARVSGLVMDNNGRAVELAQIVFYDSSQSQVGLVTANLKGVFNASVPTSAVRFNIVSNSLSTSEYFRFYTYGPGSYSPLVASCSAPLPKLANGSTTPLPYPLVVAAISGADGVQNTPPPPPTCSP